METETLVAKAEFYIILSRAFLPPTDPESHAAFTHDLPKELREIGAMAGYQYAEDVDAYIEAMDDIPHHTALLQTYAGFFLMPPREVQLHVSVYLDGSILGRSCDALQAFYRKHGVGRSDDFRDLPDHLSVVLEFLALIYARAAEANGDRRAELLADAMELNRSFLLSWLPTMKRQLARMQQKAEDHRGLAAAPAIYLHLAEILEKALVSDAGQISPELQQVLSASRESEGAPPDIKVMAKCIACSADIAPEGRIRRVRKVLEKQGIDPSHLDLCPRCRGGDLAPMGMQHALGGEVPGRAS